MTGASSSPGSGIRRAIPAIPSTLILESWEESSAESTYSGSFTSTTPCAGEAPFISTTCTLSPAGASGLSGVSSRAAEAPERVAKYITNIPSANTAIKESPNSTVFLFILFLLVFGYNYRAQTAARRKRTRDGGLFGVAGFYHVIQNFISDIFHKNTHIAVFQQIIFQRF